MAKSSFKVLLPIFPGFNTLDLNGPAEVLGNTALPENTFELIVASATEHTKACEGITIRRDISFASLLGRDDGEADSTPSQLKLGDFDALVLAGGRRWAIDAILNAKGQEDGGLLDLIEAFVQEKSGKENRWLISICTAAELLASRGLLAGRKATTHWAAIPNLKALCGRLVEEKGVSNTEIQRVRWVDCGKHETGVRIVTSGGVSCGIDCTLWYVSQVVDLERAKKVALFMDYNWSFEEVGYTRGHLI